MTLADAPALPQLKTSQPLSTVHETSRERRWALILPREHGAWGLLLVPLVTGASVGLHEHRNLLPPLLLLIAALSLFWLRTPLESLLGTSPLHAQTKDERRHALVAVAALGSLAAFALVALLWHGRNRGLLWTGLGIGVSFIVQALLKIFCRNRRRDVHLVRSAQSILPLRMLAEIVGAMGLALSAPAAYYVVTGRFGSAAWMLWLSNLLFAGNQIHYVQLRIHSSRVAGVWAKLAHGWPFALGQTVMLLVLVVAGLRGTIPWLLLVAFIPILFRGYVYFLRQPTPLIVRRLGWSELAQSVAFCILFVAAFAIGR